MAKSKEPEVNAEEQLKLAQQRISQLELEKKQLEQELSTVRSDPFRSREGWQSTLESVYETLFQAHFAVKRGGTGTIIERQMEKLRPEIGEERVASLERSWRGMS